METSGDKRQLACATCAKAKSRCVPGPLGEEKCERCHRLNKPCISRSPAPSRSKSRGDRSRVVDLERRASGLSSQFDGSVIAFDSKQPVDDGRRGEVILEGLHGSRISDLPFHHVFSQNFGDGGFSSAWMNNNNNDGSEASTSATWRSQQNLSSWPSPAEAQIRLTNYRQFCEHLFPFVHIPANLTAVELRAHRPYLWKSLMVVCVFMNSDRQHSLGEELLEEIIGEAFLNGDKSLDLLQSLLLLIAWFHHALKTSRLINLLFLTRSMCLSLNMGTCNQLSSQTEAANLSLDALRAYAGTYYVNTFVFATNKRSDSLMESRYLEICCNILETAKRHELDELAVDLARSQQLAQSISLTISQSSMESDEQTMQEPLMITVQSFQEQLNSLESSLSPGLRGHETLLGHIAVAGVLLTDFAISENHGNITPTDRINILWSCARYLRTFFNIRIPNQAPEPPSLPLQGSDISYSILTVMRLVTLRLPGWNTWQVAQELGFGCVMDWALTHLRKVAATRRAGVRGRHGVSPSTVSSGPTRISSEEDALEKFVQVAQGLRAVFRTSEEKAKQGSLIISDVDGIPIIDGLNDAMGDDFWGQFMGGGISTLADLTYLDF